MFLKKIDLRPDINLKTIYLHIILNLTSQLIYFDYDCHSQIINI